MGEVRSCGLCHSPGLELLLDMGDQPLAEAYGSGKRYPLRLMQCGRCSLVQLSHIAPQHEMFPAGHPYATGNTQALRDHFAGLAVELYPRTSAGDLVIDIGANDGTLLAGFPGDRRRVAVEPTDQALKCLAKGIPAYRSFFSRELARKMRETYGPAKVVTATNVLAHVPSPHDFAAGVVDLLGDDGVFVTENHDVAAVLDGLQIDTIYHEHLRCYSPFTLSYLLTLHGLDVFEVERISTHGGSFRIWARKRRNRLKTRAERAEARLRELCYDIAARTGTIYGVGATTRATPLLHFAQLEPFITCVCEVPGSEKIGLTMPGTTIPIVDEVRLIEDQPSHALLFSWHIAGEIIPKLRELGYRGKFIIPLPEPAVLDG